ncbi:DUF1853 family protein [Olleya sp. YS]|uniref:DUF1853 family protein n=1 Tax=Olleya sp. YS TaxID=3028318 RepID=UPI0024342873|nr:DUF1853 family protein [Olleya sp. YS]WGD34508.1 DUF1853 family protein [Olleya sp. YS]
MTTKTEDFQAQFRGFYNTPHLFLSDVFGMHPFTKSLDCPFVLNIKIKPNTRLGLRVEQYVFEELKHFETIKLLAENIQIQETVNHTIGELDCLYLDDGQPTHLEIQFKYYLYDASLGNSEIDCLIGPMRKDSLLEKLNKLKTKQLPLLYADATQPLLERFQLKAEDFKQQLYFKAQIFIPFGETIEFNSLNNSCVYGFYFKYHQLDQFKDCKFYIPKKIDWLLDLDTNVNWSTYKQIQPQMTTYQAEAYSPLVWLKFKNGEMTKCFVVAW